MKNKATQIIRNTAVNIGRLLMAATFIFSGYVKAIDPLGTQYKLADYLQAMGIGSLLPEWTLLVGAVLLAALEFSLGIFLLFAIRRHLVSRIVLALMSIMTLLTLWIVIANPVKDCGCFGDAIKLTNGETLAKNIVLLVCARAVAGRKSIAHARLTDAFSNRRPRRFIIPVPRSVRFMP